MIPKRDNIWFEFELRERGETWREKTPARYYAEAVQTMQRVYPNAMITLISQHDPGVDPLPKRGPSPVEILREQREREQRQRKAEKKGEQPAGPPPEKPEKASAPNESAPSPAGELDFRAILKLDSDATLADAKKAYLREIKRYHPDRVADLGEEFAALAEQKAREINQAFVAAKKALR